MAGYITTKSDVKKTIQEGYRDVFGNLSFGGAYTGIDYSKQQAEAQLNKQFGEAVGAAYAASQQQRSSIISSSLGQGYKQQLLKSNEDALVQAYSSYLSQLKSSQASIEQQAAQSYSSVNELAKTEAQNIADYKQSHFDYYDYLVENYSDELLNDQMWSGYKVPVQKVDESGNPVVSSDGTPVYETDENGNTLYRMKTRAELIKSTYEEDNGVKQWTGLYDDKGNLTIRGVDFFDLMQNYFATRDTEQGIESFDQYLMENNPDLLEWSNTYNPYDYTEAGTNKGSFKTMVGMTSSDYTYQFAERFGGLTTGEVTKMYDTFRSKVEEFAKLPTEKTSIGVIKTSVTELQKLAEDLGIQESELGENFTWKGLMNELENNENLTPTQADTSAKVGASMGGGAVAGTAIGSKVGAAAGGTLLPGAGALPGSVAGAIVGALVGIAAGAMGSIPLVEKDSAAREKYVKESEKLYAQAVNTLITYSLQKRRQQEVDYYRNNNF